MKYVEKAKNQVGGKWNKMKKKTHTHTSSQPFPAVPTPPSSHVQILPSDKTRNKQKLDPLFSLYLSIYWNTPTAITRHHDMFKNNSTKATNTIIFIYWVRYQNRRSYADVERVQGKLPASCAKVLRSLCTPTVVTVRWSNTQQQRQQNWIKNDGRGGSDRSQRQWMRSLEAAVCERKW